MNYNLTEYDLGLGTTYERYSVNKLIEKIAVKNNIKNVLEGPIDGITGIKGINSLILCGMNLDITVALPDAGQCRYASEIARKIFPASGIKFELSADDLSNFTGREFNLVWNFNALPRCKDPVSTIKNMCKISNKFVLIFVSNTLNYGFLIHRLHHIKEKVKWDHGNIEFMNIKTISRLLKENGMKIKKHFWTDVPWWPDIDSPIEEVAVSFFPFLKGIIKKSNRLDRYKWNIENIPYYDNRIQPIVEKHGFIENSPLPSPKFLFAHHRGILAEKT